MEKTLNTNTDNQQKAQDLIIPREWRHGPVKNKNRKVTDKICLIVFLVNLISVSSIVFWSFNLNYDQARFNPRDSSGNVCGEAALKEIPFLYMQSFQLPYQSVCVKKCPRFDYNQIKNIGQENNISPNLDFIQILKQNENKIKIRNSLNGIQSLSVFDETLYKYQFSQQQFDLYRNNFNVDCFVNNEIKNCQQSQEFSIYDSYEGKNNYCIPLNPHMQLQFNQIFFNIQQSIVTDFEINSINIFKCILFILIVSFILNCFMKRQNVLILHLLYYLSCGSLLIIGILGLYRMSFIKNNAFNLQNDNLTIYRARLFSFIFNRNFTLNFFFIFITIAGIYLMIQGIQYNTQFKTLSIINKINSNFQMGLFSGDIFSLLISAVQLGFALIIFKAAKKIIFNQETLSPEITGNPFVFIKWSLVDKLVMIRLIIGSIWIYRFLNSVKSYLIVGTTVNWYFKSKIPKWRVMFHCLSHNSGTLAAQSFINQFQLIYEISKLFGRVNLLAQVFGFKDLTVSYIGSLDLIHSNEFTYWLNQQYKDSIGKPKKLIDHYYALIWLVICLIGFIFYFQLYFNNIESLQTTFNVVKQFAIILILSQAISKVFLLKNYKQNRSLLICYMIEKQLNRKHQIDITHCPLELMQAINKENVLYEIDE